MSQICHN